MLSKVHPFYYLGGFFGGILGFIIAKIYQIWAMIYRETRFDSNMPSSWPSDSPPLWIRATEHPSKFSFWVVVLFIIVGIVSTVVLLNNSYPNRKDDE